MNRLGSVLYNIIKKVYSWVLSFITCVFGLAAAKRFDARLRFGRKLDLRSPVTLADKVSYIGLFSLPDAAVRCTDKWEVREYVREKGLEDILIPVFGEAVPRAEDIDFDALPDRFVLKATHGCKMNHICTDKALLDERKVRKEAERWLRTTYGSFSVEPHYKKLSHRVYCERMLAPAEELTEYKFFCCNGTPCAVLVCTERNGGSLRSKVKMKLYDMQWHRIDGLKAGGNHAEAEMEFDKPAGFEEMKRIAGILSQDFDFVRVDLYNVEDRIFFGELTFTPANGVFESYTDEFLRSMGEKLKIAGENAPSAKIKLGMIGHFGGEKAFFDGQTIKTRTLWNAFEKYCADDFELISADTYFIKHDPPRFLFQLTKCLISCDNVVVLLSNKGRKILFPFLYAVSAVTGKKIYHSAIGGRLADEAEKPRFKKYISAFTVNWVESKVLESRLRAMGVDSAEYMPNFKNIEILDASGIKPADVPPYRFCTFSRVMKEKGINDAIEAICAVNKTMGNVATLDIYGQIEPAYEEEFRLLVKNCSESVKYCGAVEPDESVSVLSEYYMLLFPTYWSGEGFPGTVIDAMASGLPVIARKWQYCDEMLQHGVTGYCYPYDEPQLLPELIMTAIKSENDIMRMRENCLIGAERYSPETCIAEIADKIKSSGR